MVDFDPITAQKRIDALRAQQEASQNINAEPSITDEIRDQAKELTDLENKLELEQDEKEAEGQDIETKRRVMTNEELDAEAREKLIQEDPGIMAINGMRKKAQVEEFILREFGIDLDPQNMTLKQMQAEAVRLRTERMFE
jgi:hypothetical protein